MINIFKSKNPFVLGFILLISLSLWIQTFLGEASLLVNSSSMPLYEVFIQLVPSIYIQLSLALLLFVLQILYLQSFSNNFKILEENFFLHLLIFSLIVNSITSLQQLYPIYISSLLFMMAINKIFQSLNTDNAISNYFEASLLISLSSLFYFNVIFYLPIVWIGLFIIRPIIWREWLISIIGAFLPYIFVSSYYFVFVDPEYRWFLELFETINFGYSKISLNLTVYLIVGFSVLITFLQLLKRKNLSVSNRKIKVLFIWIIAITFIIFFFVDNNALQLIYIYAFVSTFFITNYLTTVKRNWFASLILLTFIGINVFEQFF